MRSEKEHTSRRHHAKVVAEAQQHSEQLAHVSAVVGYNQRQWSWEVAQLQQKLAIHEHAELKTENLKDEIMQLQRLCNETVMKANA